MGQSTEFGHVQWTNEKSLVMRYGKVDRIWLSAIAIAQSLVMNYEIVFRVLVMCNGTEHGIWFSAMG
jgi:hypothetical protein